jgi:hypothetical protein
MKPIRTIIALTMLLACACSSDHTATENDPVPFTGTVTYLDFEGGFYGIVTNAGENLYPINLEQDHKIDGLTVHGTYALSGTATIHQWGTPVEITYVTIPAPTADG